MGKSDYKELVSKAKKISIVSVMDEQGMDYIDMRNFAQGIEHDSLMIDKRKNRFYWNSQIEDGRVVGGDVIDFVTRFFNKSHMEALNYLTQEDHEKLTETSAYMKPKEPFQYYFKHDTQFDAVRNYLVNERGLSGILIDALHDKKFIHQDKYKQAIFAWSDTGKAVGASVIGTEYNPTKYEKYGRFKGIARNSDGNYGFNVTLGTPDRLYVFESPVDMLSYWTMNPTLNNCMLAEMEGLKEQSVYKFIEQMYISKGALPTEGIYLGVDNDFAGHRFFDNLSKLSYVDPNGKEFSFEKLIPHDRDIPKSNLEVYTAVGNGYGVDWRMVAAVHKSITNFSEDGKIANSWNVRTFYSGEDFDLGEESKRVAEMLLDHEVGQSEYDLQKLFQVQEDLPAPSIDGIVQKINHYYKEYRDYGYHATDILVKDWNDALRYQVLVGQEARLLESIFHNKEQEEMKIVRDEEKKKYVALSLSDRQREPFFEADSPQEAEMLVNNYGFQAVDKEDRKKYGIGDSKEPQKVKEESKVLGFSVGNTR